MDFQQILNGLAIALTILSVLLATFSFLLLNRQQITKSFQKRTQRDLRQPSSDDKSKETDQTASKFDKDNWKSLEEIIGNIKKLNDAKPGADSAFLSIVQILLSSLLQTLNIDKKQKPLPDYENISFMIMINDTDGSIYYSEVRLQEKTTDAEYYQSDVTILSKAGAFFEYNFTGTGINCFIGVLRDKEAVVDIYFDKEPVLKKTIPASPEAVQQSLFQRSNLERKEYSLRVVLKEGELALDAIGIYS